MSEITDMLNKIEAWCYQNKNNGASEVKPGLTIQEINKIINGYDFKLPQEIIELYSWSNGGYFYDGKFYEFGFFSLEDAVEKLQYKDSYNEENNEYILFIGGQEDCYLWTDVKTENTEIAPIYYNDELTNSPRYPSLTAMLKNITTRLKID